MNTTMKVVLTIAGSDSGGGAGIQADLKTFEALGVFGTTAITAITAQNTTGVRSVFELPVSIVRDQIAAVFDDFAVSAVKIGMLSSVEIIDVVASELARRASGVPIVLDPVMVATSGDRLMRDDAVRVMIERLLPLARIITPNTNEASVLSGVTVDDLQSMRVAATRIRDLGCPAVLVKGGHIEPRRGRLIDVLVDGSAVREYETEALDTKNTHGTGCTMASAIAALVALGAEVGEAVAGAQAYVHGALRAAPGLGRGHGPLLHAWSRRAD